MKARVFVTSATGKLAAAGVLNDVLAIATALEPR